MMMITTQKIIHPTAANSHSDFIKTSPHIKSAKAQGKLAHVKTTSKEATRNLLKTDSEGRRCTINNLQTNFGNPKGGGGTLNRRL